MQIDQKIIDHEKDAISYGEFLELSECIEQRYPFSSYRFWMWKVFQYGFALGKRAERARRKERA